LCDLDPNVTGGLCRRGRTFRDIEPVSRDPGAVLPYFNDDAIGPRALRKTEERHRDARLLRIAFAVFREPLEEHAGARRREIRAHFQHPRIQHRTHMRVQRYRRSPRPTIASAQPQQH
jgi:hypothetical protein